MPTVLPRIPLYPFPPHVPRPQVEFLSSSEEINKRPDEYWTLVMDIARKNNLKRIVRWGVRLGSAKGVIKSCVVMRPVLSKVPPEAHRQVGHVLCKQ